MTDPEMGLILGVTEKMIYLDRKELGLLKQSGRKKQKDVISMVIEMSAMGKTIVGISELLNLTEEAVKRIIRVYATFIEKSDKTITLVIESKINFDKASIQPL